MRYRTDKLPLSFLRRRVDDAVLLVVNAGLLGLLGWALSCVAG